MLKLTILGSGTMMPTKTRNPSAFLVETNDTKILLDCGHETIRRMIDLNIDPQTLQAVFISHFHTDHAGDAFNLVHSRFVEDTYKKQIYKELIFIGPENIEENFKKWRTIFWPEPKEYYPLKFYKGPQKIKIGEIDIETFPIIHTQWFQSIAIKIQTEGKTIIYTGDMGGKNKIEDLAIKMENADLLITEATYEYPTPNHFTVDQLEELVKLAKIKKVLLVHFRPRHDGKMKTILAGKKNFQIAEDRTTLVI